VRSNSAGSVCWLLALALLAPVTACTSPHSYVILLLEPSIAAPITGVTQITVEVLKTSGERRTLT